MIVHDPIILNLSDLDELLLNADMLNPVIQDRLSAIEFRIRTWPKRFARPCQNYRHYAGILAFQPDSRFATRLCKCSIRNQPCGQWKFCPYCAWRRKMMLLAKYLPEFFCYRWFALTISFAGFLRLDSCDPAGLAFYWSACVAAVRRMVAEGYFHGAVWAEDLHILSIIPSRVLPHLHALVHADQITMCEIELLQNYVREFVAEPKLMKELGCEADEAIQIRLPVTTRTKPIRNRYHFANALGYLAKPIRLAEPYMAEWANVVGEDRLRLQAPAFNQQFGDIVEGYRLDAFNRHQIDYKGTMDARTGKKFIGIPREIREQLWHTRYIKDILKEENLDHAGDFDPDDPETWGEPAIEEIDAENNPEWRSDD